MSKAERKEILELLAAGKITAAEAAELLTTSPSTPSEPPAIIIDDEPVAVADLKAQEAAVAPSDLKSTASNGKKANWLHVRVSNMETGKSKVTVNIPLRMVNFGLKVGRKFSSDLQDLDLDSLNQMVGEMERGILVDVQDEESNEHVQIYVD